jgi:hypothetical protein
MQHLEGSGTPVLYIGRTKVNDFNTNEDIATKFEQEYVRCHISYTISPLQILLQYPHLW